MNIPSVVFNNLQQADSSIFLIGPSGVGKSLLGSAWAQYLERDYVDGDDYIAQHPLLQDQISTNRAQLVQALGDWLGQPYSNGYAKREALYLRCEQDVMTQLIGVKNSIVALTGSSIYLPEQMGAMRARPNAAVIYLQPICPKPLLQRYLKDAKPIVWNGEYKPQDSEDHLQTVHRCYPKLMQNRAYYYEQFSNSSLLIKVSDANL